MPIVPRYTQTERPRGYQNVQPSKGGQIMANAWQQAGKALQGAGDTMDAMAQDMMRRQNEAVAQEAMTAYEDLRHTFWNGVVENRKGKNALGDEKTKDVMTQAAEWQRDTVASLMDGKTEGQKQLLLEYFNKRGLNLQEQASSWQNKQWDVYESATFDASVKAQLLRAKDDPSQIEAAMANIGQLTHNYNSARGLPEEQTALTVRAAWDDTAKSIAQGYLDMDDPGKAEAFLSKYEKQLSPGEVKAMRGKVKTKREALTLKAEKLKEKAEKEKEKAELQEAADNILDSTKWFDGTDEEREAKATELCEAISDPERRAKVWGKVKSQLSFEKARSNAQAGREVRAFLELAKREGWSQADYAAKLAEANISDKARRKLEDPKTRVPQETFANRKAMLDLMEKIDLGPERGGIDYTDENALEDLMWNAGLTTAQEKRVLEHARGGGNKGRLTVSMVNTAAKMLYPNDAGKAKNVATYYEQVEAMLEPGKQPTVGQVKNILAQLEVEGEFAYAGTLAQRQNFYIGQGEDMTLGEAMKRGYAGVFYTDDGKHAKAIVPGADYDRIAASLSEAGVLVTPERVEKMYIEEQRKK